MRLIIRLISKLCVRIWDGLGGVEVGVGGKGCMLMYMSHCLFGMWFFKSTAFKNCLIS